MAGWMNERQNANTDCRPLRLPHPCRISVVALPACSWIGFKENGLKLCYGKSFISRYRSNSRAQRPVFPARDLGFTPAAPRPPPSCPQPPEGWSPPPASPLATGHHREVGCPTCLADLP